MNMQSVEILFSQAATLSLDDQLLLMARLAKTVRQQRRQVSTARKWQEIRGIVKGSMLGEDAQTWVSRTRQEGDQQRAQQFG